MEMSARRRTRTSSWASTTTLASTTTSITLPTNLEETASSSTYFPPELIPLIASSLTTLPDFFALRSACRTYRNLVPPSPSNLASQGPLLIVPHEASASIALFNAPLRRLVQFCLRRSPLAHADPCFTFFHSFGWRVAIQDISTPAPAIASSASATSSQVSNPAYPTS